MRGAVLLVLTVFLFGCTQAPEECVCTEEYAPVCGADGTTYSNSCKAGCAGVAVEHEGACIIEERCTDSDGGKVADVAGTANTAGLNYSDYCTGFDSVKEYFCEEDSIGVETLSCDEGYECSEGACIETVPETPGVCSDSDAKDLRTVGTVTTDEDSYTDSCSDLLVREYYCVGGEVKDELMECEQGYACDGGRCQKIGQTCEDSDGGRNIEQGGTLTLWVNLVSGEYLDKCLPDGRLREYYCDGNEMVIEDLECPPEDRCVQASCREDICIDSDDGYSIFQVGAANKGDVIERDYCTDDHNGVEFYCESGDIMSAEFTCPMNKLCVDGRCEE